MKTSTTVSFSTQNPGDGRLTDSELTGYDGLRNTGIQEEADLGKVNFAEFGMRTGVPLGLGPIGARTTLGDHIGIVVGHGAEQQMRGIAAQGHVAFVHDDERRLGDYSIGEGPSESMGVGVAPSVFEGAIPMFVDRAGPEPTFVPRLDGDSFPEVRWIAHSSGGVAGHGAIPGAVLPSRRETESFSAGFAFSSHSNKCTTLGTQKGYQSWAF